MSRLARNQPEGEEMANLHPGGSTSADALSSRSSVSAISSIRACRNNLSGCQCGIKENIQCLKEKYPHAQSPIITTPTRH